MRANEWKLLCEAAEAAAAWGLHSAVKYCVDEAVLKWADENEGMIVEKLAEAFKHEMGERFVFETDSEGG